MPASTHGLIRLEFDIFELMFYEILVIHIHNSHLVYNFYEQPIKLFFKFYMFYENFGLLLLYRSNDNNVNCVLFNFVNRSC